MQKTAELILLLLLATGLPAFPAALEKKDPTEIAGVPVSVSAPDYHQPLAKSAVIGNDYRAEEGGEVIALDYQADRGVAVLVARSGIVSLVKNFSNIGGLEANLFQFEENRVEIDHLDGTVSQYRHLARQDNPVRLGEYVIQGERIGYCGDTGVADSPFLTFQVVDVSSGKNLPLSFGDYAKNHGVPAKGQKTPAAEAPAIPQKDIEVYKQYWRAALEAESKGLIDLAWKFTASVPKKQQHPDYFYHCLLTVKEQVYRNLLLGRFQALMALNEPTSEEGLEALRYCETLDKSRHPKIDNGLFELKKAMDAWDREQFKTWKRERTAIRFWVAGLNSEWLGDRASALSSYQKALKRSGPLFESRAGLAMKGHIMTVVRESKDRLARLTHEMTRARPQHRHRLRGEATQAWERCQRPLKAWKDCFPEEAEAADKYFQSIQDSFLALTGK